MELPITLEARLKRFCNIKGCYAFISESDKDIILQIYIPPTLSKYKGGTKERMIVKRGILNIRKSFNLLEKRIKTLTKNIEQCQKAN